MCNKNVHTPDPLSLPQTHKHIHIISLIVSLKGAMLLNCVEERKFSVSILW